VKKEFTRREVLGVGLGAAALATSVSVVAAAQPEENPSQGETDKLSKLNKFKKYGEELETSLVLRTSPIAVKMIEMRTKDEKE